MAMTPLHVLRAQALQELQSLDEASAERRAELQDSLWAMPPLQARMVLGWWLGSKAAFEDLLEELHAKYGWRGPSYLLLTRNCNHFVASLCELVLDHKSFKPAPGMTSVERMVPPYLTQLSDYGMGCGCLCPCLPGHLNQPMPLPPQALNVFQGKARRLHDRHQLSTRHTFQHQPNHDTHHQSQSQGMHYDSQPRHSPLPKRKTKELDSYIARRSAKLAMELQEGLHAQQQQPQQDDGVDEPGGAGSSAIARHRESATSLPPEAQEMSRSGSSRRQQQSTIHPWPDPHAPPPTYPQAALAADLTAHDDATSSARSSSSGARVWSPFNLAARPPSRLQQQQQQQQQATRGIASGTGGRGAGAQSCLEGDAAHAHARAPGTSLLHPTSATPSHQHMDAEGRPISVLSGGFIELEVAGRWRQPTPEPQALMECYQEGQWQQLGGAAGSAAVPTLPGGLPSPATVPATGHSSGASSASADSRRTGGRAGHLSDPNSSGQCQVQEQQEQHEDCASHNAAGVDQVHQVHVGQQQYPQQERPAMQHSMSGRLRRPPAAAAVAGMTESACVSSSVVAISTQRLHRRSSPKPSGSSTIASASANIASGSNPRGPSAVPTVGNSGSADAVIKQGHLGLTELPSVHPPVGHLAPRPPPAGLRGPQQQ